MKYAIHPRPVLGPCPCQDCGELLFWARRQTRVDNVVVGSLRWRGWTGLIHKCLARARAKAYNGAGGVSTEPNRLTAATVAHLLTPGDSGRAASGSKTDA